MESMVESIIKEIEIQRNYLSQPYIDTLYFGGGTPSLLNYNQLERIVLAVKKYYTFSPTIEFTLEANPDDLTKAKLLELKELGINRLSVGLQSFEDRLLQFFNRAHNKQMAIKSVKLAQEIGFDNISIDLIFGAPDQSIEDLRNDLNHALALNTKHISIYGLTIEEKTVFGKWSRQNKLKPIDEDLAAAHFTEIMEQLDHAGMIQYEISNFCRPGYESKHNSSYWKGEPYLGLGPSAHSYNQITRQYNVSNNTKYIKSLEKNEIPCETETLSQVDLINEMILIQLRTIDGLNLYELKKKYNYDIYLEKKSTLNLLITQKKVVVSSKNLLLTQQGKLIADYITEKLMI